MGISELNGELFIKPCLITRGYTFFALVGDSKRFIHRFPSRKKGHGDHWKRAAIEVGLLENPRWVWWCSQLPPFSVVSHGSFWPNGPSRSSMWAFGRASNCAKRFLRCHVSWWCPICIKRTSQRRRNRSESCWKDATVDSRFTSILIMVTFFWLHFCTWPRRSLHRAPFVWELQWPHFEIPTPQYPVQNGVQREKMWRGAGLEWLMLLKNSQQRVIARHGTEKFPLRFPIDYKHFIRI